MGIQRILVHSVVCVSLLAGCATRRQMVDVSLQLEQIRQEQQQIRQSLARLDSLAVQQINSSSRLNAELNLGMKELQERLLLVESRLADAGSSGSRPTETLQVSRPGTTGQDSAGAKAPGDDLDPDKIYRAAYLDLTRGEYAMAINGFKEFLKRYPNTAISDNALYWIGECHYTLKDYAQAQQAFERMIAEYPDSEKIASAKFKLGMSLFNQRMRTKAKQYFQDVVKDYPGSEEARQAGEMLKRYN